MAWTAEKVKEMRESNPSKAAESSGWTAEKVRAVRTKTPNPSTVSSTVLPKSNIYADALKQYTERHASDMGEVDARNDTSLAGRVSTGKKPLSQAAPAATEMALDMGQKWGVPAKSGNVLENVDGGAMAYGTGRAQELRASFAKDSVPDEFDRINQWMDIGDNKNLADAVRRVDNTHGAYTDADLIKKGGWTQAQIDEARKMNAALDAIPAWQRGVRRAANTIGGIGDTVAAAPVLGAEYGVQAGKNIDATLKNWKQVEQEVKGDEHAQSLFDLLTDVDMDYNPTWPESRNRELISMGYNSKEIREMRQKLAHLPDRQEPERGLPALRPRAAADGCGPERPEPDPAGRGGGRDQRSGEPGCGGREPGGSAARPERTGSGRGHGPERGEGRERR